MYHDNVYVYVCVCLRLCPTLSQNTIFSLHFRMGIQPVVSDSMGQQL